MQCHEISVQLKGIQATLEQMQQKIPVLRGQIEKSQEAHPEQNHLISQQAQLNEKLIRVYRDCIAIELHHSRAVIPTYIIKLSQIPLTLPNMPEIEKGKAILKHLVENKCFGITFAFLEAQVLKHCLYPISLINPMQQMFHLIFSQHIQEESKALEEATDVIGDIFNAKRRKLVWAGLVEANQSESALSIEKCEEWINQMIDLMPPFEGESRQMLERVLISHVFCTIFQLYTGKQNTEAVLAFLSKILEFSHLLTEKEVEPLAERIFIFVQNSDVDLDKERQDETLKFLSCFPSPLLTPLINSLTTMLNNSFMMLTADDTGFDAQEGLWDLICKMHRLLDDDSIPFSTIEHMIYTCLLANPDLFINIIEKREPEFIEFPTLLVKFLENEPTTLQRLNLSLEDEEEIDRSDDDESEMESEEDEFKLATKGVQEAIMKVFPTVVKLLQRSGKSEVITAIIQSFPFDQRNELNTIAESVSVNS